VVGYLSLATCAFGGVERTLAIELGRILIWVLDDGTSVDEASGNVLLQMMGYGVTEEQLTLIPHVAAVGRHIRHEDVVGFIEVLGVNLAWELGEPLLIASFCTGTPRSFVRSFSTLIP
jgi:hypothetical protein